MMHELIRDLGHADKDLHGTMESEIESEEEEDDMVWLRAGQSATYPPKFPE